MIKRLTLTNFRNHETLRIEPAAKNIILIGSNGAGKTNILEALSLLNGGTGFRKDAPTEMARFNQNNFAAVADLADGNTVTVHWEVGMPGRRAKINDEFSILSELAHLVSIIWLTPRENMLFSDAPSVRRAFFDNMIAGFDSHHIGRVMRLNKLLSERAFALRNNPDSGWMDIIEENITATAVAVADARVRWATEMSHFFEDGEIRPDGLMEPQLIDGIKPSDIELEYRRYLSDNRFLTAEKQVIDGAHKTDFLILNKLLRIYADKTSSGQQKMILGKLVIANAKLLAVKNPTRPIIMLLDEADGHLDAHARGELFRALDEIGAQVWMTGTDASTFKDAKNAEIVPIG